jgi:uncharacterized membrane protein YbhN (UPF0104 family)
MTTLIGSRRPRKLLGLAALLAVVGAAAFIVAFADLDGRHGLGGLTRSVHVGVAGVHWQFALLVVAMTGLHYVSTATAARAAATTPLPLRETFLVQLAAAAASRVAPGGLGGAVVNARYFTRRGMDMRAAVGAVTMLGVLGALADLVVFLLLISVGRLLGLGGGAAELGTLSAKLAGIGGALKSSAILIALVAVVTVGVVVIGLRHRRRRRPTSAREGDGFWTAFRSLARRPKSLAVLLTASGSTSLILALAFAATTGMLAGPQPKATVGAIVVAYMAAAAAANVVPIPSGVGSVEAAMVAVLVTAHVPAAHAVAVVLTYRVITFWMPAVVGVAVAWRLRRAGAL